MSGVTRVRRTCEKWVTEEGTSRERIGEAWVTTRRVGVRHEGE